MDSLTQSLSKIRARFQLKAHVRDASEEPQEASKNIQTTVESAKAITSVADVRIPVQREQFPIPGAFSPSPDSSRFHCRRAAEKHRILTAKLASLNESFQLGLEAHEILDPEIVQATLLQYYHSTQKPSQDQNGNKTHRHAQTVDKDHPFHLIHRALPHESLILATSLGHKICLGSRLQTCLNRVKALDLTEKTPPPTNPLPEHHDLDSNSSISLGFSFWESRVQTTQSSPGLNSAPSTPRRHSSLSSLSSSSSSSSCGLCDPGDTDSDYTDTSDSDSDFEVSPKIPTEKHSEEDLCSCHTSTETVATCV